MVKLYVKKWIVLFLTLVSSFIIGIRTSMGFFHLLFWFLIAFIAISWAWILLEYFGIRLYVQRKTVNRVNEDDVLEVEALIRNKSFLPIFNVVLEDYLPCAPEEEKRKSLLVDHLGGGFSKNLEYQCLCPLRGKYRLGPFKVYYFDPMGLFFLKRIFHEYSELYVYPATFPIRKLPELTKGVLPWFGIQTSRFSGDEDEFFGIREYKEGDPIKKIHWLSTARKMKLIVKQFQRQSYYRATLLFNLEKDKNFGTGKHKVAEYIIKIVASLAKYLSEKNISFEVVASTKEIVYFPFNKGPEHYEDILKFLAVVQAESTKTLADIFEEHSQYIPNNSNLILIMLDKDWAYLGRFLELMERDISIITVLVISSTFLHSFDHKEVEMDINIKLSQAWELKPILISCRDPLAETFNQYVK